MPSETTTSPEFRAGSTPPSPIPRPAWSSTAACSLGVRRRDAPRSGANYYMARLNGGDVAAVGSIPQGAPQQATWNTYIRGGRRRDETAARVRGAGGTVLSKTLRRHGRGRMAVLRRPPKEPLCVWQARRIRAPRSSTKTAH